VPSRWVYIADLPLAGLITSHGGAQSRPTLAIPPASQTGSRPRLTAQPGARDQERA
jgi:hypothetical protein